LVGEDGVRWASGKRGTAVRGTAGWDIAMLKAKGQAEQYARALPVGEGWPPFLVVVDVGHAIELYSEFSCSGKSYLPFPDPRSHRFTLSDLVDDAVRERLRRVWSEPLSLDPARQSARVTRQIADRLALLAKSFEQSGHSPEKVGNFLKRCLFTMFAEDVGAAPQKFHRAAGQPQRLCRQICAAGRIPLADHERRRLFDGAAGKAPPFQRRSLRTGGCTPH
jgi:hypothetical protein